jgi:YHS domain-containing protein
LDVDFSSANDKNWVQRIAKNDITGGADFTHIIELLVDDEEVKHRALNMRYALTPKDPEAADEVDTHADHGKVFSKWERDGRIPKPKPKKELLEGEEEEEEEEEEEGDENKPKPFDEAELFTRICDEKDTFLEELEHYATIERPAVDDLICNLFEHTFIKLDVAGMDPDEIAATVKFRLQNDESAPLRPIGRVIQDPSGAFKDLLQDGFDPDPESETFDGIGEGRLPRQWSMWRQQDPVCLSKGEVKIGAAEFAVDYANNVFCFSNEENRNEFAK